MGNQPSSFHISDFENLQEDLMLLQASIQQGRLDRSRAGSQCAEILGALRDIVQGQGLADYARVIAALGEYVTGAAADASAFTSDFWGLTLDVLDELLAALEMTDAGMRLDQAAMARHIQAFEGRLETLESQNGHGAPAEANELEFDSVAGMDGDDELFLEANASGEFEELQVARPVTDPPAKPRRNPEDGAAAAEADSREASAAQRMLQEATAAAAAGDSERAQTLAQKAATALAEESRQRKAHLLGELREQLLLIESETHENEQGLEQARSALATQQDSIEELRARRAEAEAAFAEHSEALEQVRDELEDVDRQIAELQERRQDLMQQFEEVLPAKEAAERTFQHAAAEAETIEATTREAQDRIEEYEQNLAAVAARRQEVEDQILALESALPA